jgi:hypothetical protein
MSEDGILTPPANPKPLIAISPSRFAGMAKCRLREVFGAGWEPPRLPCSPAAHVGTAIHRFLEAAERGEFDPSVPASFSNRWEQESKPLRFKCKQDGWSGTSFRSDGTYEA